MEIWGTAGAPRGITAMTEQVPSKDKLYAERDIIGQGEHYTRHVSAMTGEGLHAKSEIAAELAHRDIEIERLRKVYYKANALIAYIGQQGEISSTAGEVDALQCALDDFDGGTPVSAPEPPAELAGVTAGQVKHLSHALLNVAKWLENGCDAKSAAGELRIYADNLSRASQPPGACQCVPMAQRPWKFCQDCGGRITSTKHPAPPCVFRSGCQNGQACVDAGHCTHGAEMLRRMNGPSQGEPDDRA